MQPSSSKIHEIPRRNEALWPPTTAAAAATTTTTTTTTPAATTTATATSSTSVSSTTARNFTFACTSAVLQGALRGVPPLAVYRGVLRMV